MYATLPQGLHSDGINGLQYLAHNKTVVTSSRDPQGSIIIMHIANKLDSYIFKLAWGVRCFDLRQEVREQYLQLFNSAQGVQCPSLNGHI